MGEGTIKSQIRRLRFENGEMTQQELGRPPHGLHLQERDPAPAVRKRRVDPAGAGGAGEVHPANHRGPGAGGLRALPGPGLSHRTGVRRGGGRCVRVRRLNSLDPRPRAARVARTLGSRRRLIGDREPEAIHTVLSAALDPAASVFQACRTWEQHSVTPT